MRDLLPYLKLYKKHWFGLSLGMLLGFLTLIASIGLLTLSGWFISAAALAGLTIARETFNYMLPGAGVRGAAMARTAGRWGERVVSHNATFKLLTDLRIFFFKKLAPLIPGRLSTLRDADILNRLVADVDAMDHVYLRLISPVIIGIFGILTLTAALAFFDWHLALLLGGILSVVLLVWPILFYKLGKNNGEYLTQHKAQLRVATLDWLQGYSELCLFGAESRYRNLIQEKQTKLFTNQFINAHLTGLASGLLIFVNGVTLIIMLWFAADGVGGRAPDPFIALFAFATMASFEILMPIAGAFQFLGQTLTSARRLNEVILTEPDLVFPDTSAHLDLFPDIHFDKVDFTYPDGQLQVLKNVSLSLPFGSKTAIVGQTGSGKSTLIQLLCRYWDVNQGIIKLGQSPLQDWSESDLRASMTVVSQRVDVLNGTLRDNLLMAAPDASDEDLKDVLTKVELSNVLVDSGLDVWLGDGGRQLSGGEKRRIGIARALLRDSPILLLDEPTEGLDKQTEQKIIALFSQHFANKTLIFITHRLIELERMDTICLMEEGEIVEQGSHHTLLAQQGRYFKLLQSI
ncbi:heme ABC transporter ATP-binding protein/permease CydC [Vibrio sagamiensis]|uniref:Glutathione/L-cysteine transport system ATP-binding/permease protein CydC n=1 Tax=Vibrio sagamiensis NBRC 104589 TaxID=1219064 RepID=A0A511QGI6_9VIBR|nr:cysteine/glutathione ABC transporter ATP-binding protein/permease CydC [Vibrio sagamiensis]PNQ60484.1 thiol reductant ABC exporter subunit CydC [Vibrio agarivorans]GEM75562.1 cysteine/glutathione ABC transporter ATP-binding protein/permease CydC [Vibrio sagamiensis NBRC 104589]